MSVIKGIRQNTSPENTPEGFGFYGKNVVFHRNYDEIVNEDGTLENDLTSFAVEDFIGQIPFQNKVIVFFKDTSNRDCIGLVDAGFTHTTLVSSVQVKLRRTDFNFNKDNPITGVAKLSPKGELIVAFRDSINTPKYVNLDTALDADSLDVFNLFLRGKTPSYTPFVVEGGGNLRTGVYFASIRYIDKNKSYTDCTPLSPPIYIVNHELDGNFTATKGTQAGVKTNKGIRFVLNDLDTSYNIFELIIIEVINGITNVKRVKEYTFESDSKTIVFTGSELTSPFTIEEVVRTSPDFNTVDEITSLNDSLYLAGFTQTEQDLQAIANSITERIGWQSRPVWYPFNSGAVSEPGPTAPPPNPASPVYRKDGNKRILMHGEVYAIYVQFEIDKKWSRWYHVPGRAEQVGDKDNVTVSIPSDFLNEQGQLHRKYQMDDTTTITSSSALLNPTANFRVRGTFGFWENTTETYPTDFPDFAGQKVRHHVTPSIRKLSNHLVSVDALNGRYYGIRYWDELHLTCAPISLPPEYEGKITRFRFGYAKKGDERLVLGYDILQTGGRAENDSNRRLPTAGNWSVLRDGNVDIIRSGKDIRLHSPDVMIEKPNLSNAYLETAVNIGLYPTLIGDESLTWATPLKPIGNIRISNTIRSYLTNYFQYGRRGGVNSTDDLPVSLPDSFKKLKKFRYLQRGVVSAGEGPEVFQNTDGEETAYGEVDTEYQNIYAFQSRIVTNDEMPSVYDVSKLLVIKQVKSDVFIDYLNQQVIPLGEPLNSIENPFESFATAIIEDGDTFICTHSLMTLAPLTGQVTPEQPDRGVRCFKLFLLESRYNLNQRYEIQGDISTYFYPTGAWRNANNANSYWWLDIVAGETEVNKIALSSDYREVNIFNTSEIHDHRKEYETEFPHLIIRSEQASRDTNINDGWRRYLPNQAFYTVRDRGRIIGLEAVKNEYLIIHHQYGLYRTKGNVILTTDVSQINIGKGDIFEIEPSEIGVASYGYAGLQHKFGRLLTEVGYIFTDAQRGEVFLYDLQSTATPIGNTIRPVIDDLLRYDPVINSNDNPYQGKGVQFAFDKENYRVLFSLRGEKNLTMSYDLVRKEWLCAHDYIPDGIFNTRNFMFSFKDKKIVKHNVPAIPGIVSKGKFYGTVYPSYFDFIVNEEPSKEKILSAISWLSRTLVNNVPKYDQTISHVTIWNEYGCTGRIELTSQPESIYEINDKNLRVTDNAWRFDDIIDRVKDHSQPFIGGVFDDYRPISSNIDNSLAWHESLKLRGRYFIIRLEYSNNHSVSENKSVFLQKVLPSLKDSYA